MKIRYRRLHSNIATFKKYIRGGIFAALAVSLAAFGYSEYKTQAAHAAFGGNFVFTVTPDPTPVPAGDVARFRVDYSCSVTNCNDAVIP